MSVHADPPPSIVKEPAGISTVSYATADQLGKGGFAICYRAETIRDSVPTGEIVALKIVRTKMEPAKLAQKFVTELQIHSKLSHPNVVGFHRAFTFSESTYVVLELCSSGSLADLLRRRKCVTMPEIRRFMIQVCGAVKYLHTRNIVHRDLKTGNLFLDEHMNIKVGDFGLAALLVSGKDMDAKRRTTMCGTPNYLAPEILEKGKGHNEKVDLWAIGIIFYTLAVGKAPFHAASKEEIYKKLMAGEYSWPELSSITNDISADLRDLVSKLLVPEELRPCPDKIVSHPFFKIAYVPKKMSRVLLAKTPTWPVQIPSPEVLARGYSDSWWLVCKESGVGEYAPGRCFQPLEGKRVRSIVRDIEREVARNLQPVIPIPADTIYTGNSSEGGSANQQRGRAEQDPEQDFIPAEPDGSSSRQLKEISNNEVQMPAPIPRRPVPVDTEKQKRDAALMPPPRRKKELAIQKTRTEVEKRRPADISPPSSESDKDANTDVPATKYADSTLARRPRSLRTASSAKTLARIENEVAAASTLRRAQSTRTTRTRGKQTDTIEIFDEEAPVVASTLRKQSSTQSAHQVASSGAQKERDDAVRSANNLILPATPEISAMLQKPLPTPVLPGSRPEDVLDKLKVFRDTLDSALSSTSRKTQARTERDQPSLPFVSRWVDYSRKHGVGYVLEDGTVGLIANPVTTPGAETPVIHLAARHGERWLRRVGKKMENLDKVPLHMLEESDKGVRWVRSLGMSNKQRERVNILRILWVKFGKYMNPMLDGEVEEANSQRQQGELRFVRFYQRIEDAAMGNVGIWVFNDGCVQLNFADHTKMVVAADGSMVSATILSIEGAKALKEKGEVPADLLRDRQVVVEATADFVRAARRGDSDGLVTANRLETKLEFVKSVADRWIGAGGVVL